MTKRFDAGVWIDDRLSRIVAMGGGGSSPAGNTTTTVQPWGAQQPYLLSGFQKASDLFNNYSPQYYPGATYAGQNQTQSDALSQLIARGQYNIGNLDTKASNFTGGVLTGDYGYGANPATSIYQNVAGGGAGNPANAWLQYFSGGNFGDTANGTDVLGGLARTNFAGANPSNAVFSSYASGAHAGDNPYLRSLTDSISASVTPGIQSQFINGGTLASPEAARATSAGVTTALAPELFRQYQQDQQNQLQAAGALSQNYLQGSGLQGNFARSLADLSLQGRGMQMGAATQLGQQYLQQQQQQLQAAGGLAGVYGQDMAQRFNALSGAQTVQGMVNSDIAQQYGAGTAQQGADQAAINDAVQRFNYQQTLPYWQLQQYMSALGGNMGSSTTQPYFQNNAANALSLGTGGLSLANGLASLFGGAGGGAAATGAAGVGAGAAGVSSGIGALLGTAGKALSDRRMKTDIARIGEARNGLPLYAFRYRGEPMLHVGFMADEVEQIRPEAVSTAANGMRMVDYSLAAR